MGMGMGMGGWPEGGSRPRGPGRSWGRGDCGQLPPPRRQLSWGGGGGGLDKYPVRYKCGGVGNKECTGGGGREGRKGWEEYADGARLGREGRKKKRRVESSLFFLSFP